MRRGFITVLAGIAASFLFCFLAWASPAWAHESRPLYVQIVEREPDIFMVSWKVPPSLPVYNHPRVRMPGRCRGLTASASPGRARVSSRLFGCDGGLDGAEIEIRYPAANPSVSTLIRLLLLSGESRTAVLGPAQSTWKAPVGETSLGVARTYLVLGIEHILKGMDHLLFVACLLFIAGTWRRILITVTGFTLAHSVTLALATLGVVRLPVPPVEATIALSIVLLATEIARTRRDTLTWRFPIAVASSFGLLHGFGFAAVLGEIGLPQTEIPAALLFFNLGVEVGQVAFAGALILAFLAIRRTVSAVRDREAPFEPMILQRLIAYSVGVLAAFWTFERAMSFWV